MTGGDRAGSQSSGGGRLSRRAYLLAGGAAAVGATAVAASDLVSSPSSSAPSDGRRPESNAPPTFLWLHAHFWLEPRIRRNLFALADRHDMVVVFSQPGPTRRPDAAVDEFIEGPLTEAADRGLSAWLATGVLNSMTAPEFVSDSEKREHHLDGLRSLVEEYDERFSDGRVILWQEAPIAGHWSSEGQVWDAESVENLQRLGPRIFEEQRRAVKGVNDAIDVGIFPHFPYVVDSKRPEVFPAILDDLRTRDAFPDFSMVDFYRGVYEPDVGPTGADDAVRSLIENTREHTDDREVFYMGQAHTSETGFTPSRQSIRMDVRTAIDAGADSVGYYGRFVYTPSDPERCFDPLVPKTDAGDEFRERPEATTYTLGRDRFTYAYALLFGRQEGYERSERFDLWIEGSNLDFHEHRLWLETTAGEREFVGDFNGYLDTDHLYDEARDDHVSVFHALERDRYLAGGDSSGQGADTLSLRIETDDDATDATLRSVSAVPFDPDSYVTEPEALGLLDDADPASFALGHQRVGDRLAPGESLTVPLDLEPAGETGSIDAVRYPDERETLRDLEAFEAAEGFEFDGAFDLWVVGDGLATAAGSGGDRVVLHDGSAIDAAERSAASSASEGAAAFYGIDRGSLFAGERGRDPAFSVRLESDGGDGSIGRAYAMPYFGRGNLLTPARIATLVAEDPAGARNFSLGPVDVR